MSTWINFKELRAKLDFETILRHYGVEVKRKGNQHHGFCPLPNHNGKRNSPSFSANLDRGIFQCFGCGAKGNVLEFAAMMESVDLANGTEFRALALRLQEKFCPGQTPEQSTSPKAVKPSPASTTPAIINAPLDFELKGLDASHPYLRNRGFLPETISHFGLGVCTRGSFKGRLVIQLKDQNGRLIGYAGRVIDDALISEENPRYRFPSKRIREGKVFEFRKSRFLYNGHCIEGPVEDLIVVEGFTGVWWLHQSGRRNVVATMGSDCSERQAELIIDLVQPRGRVWIMPDGDAAGERFAQALLTLIAPCRFVRWARLSEGVQPTDLTRDQIEQVLG